MARFDLTDFEWSVISPLLPNKPRGVSARRRPARSERDILAPADRRALGGYSRALRSATRPASTASTAGARPASGIAFSKPCQRLMMATFR